MAREWDSASQRTCQEFKEWLRNHIAVQPLSFFLPGGGTMLATYFTPPNTSLIMAAWYGFVGGILGLGLLYLTTYIYQLIRAPYRQRNEARQDVDRLEEEREPQLVIEGVKRENYGNAAGFSWGLVVKNKGINKAEECMGELVAMDFADKTGMRLSGWPMNQPLQWENIAEYSGDTTSIANKAVLQIINRDLVRGTIRINAQHIAYSKSYEFRETHYLPISNYPGGNNYLIVIGISSKGKAPIYALCYLRSRTDVCQMKLVEITNDEPIIEEFRQKSAARIEGIEKQLTSEWYHEIGMDSRDC